MSERDWEYSRGDRGWRLEDAGMGMLRVALLFGSAAVMLALLIVPILDQGGRDRGAIRAEGVDTISTGSIQSQGGYRVRRSVLQPSPDSVCIIRDNGARSGDC